LYYLTHIDDGEALSHPLTLERARELVENFEFDNTTSAITLEAEVEQLIGQLSFQLGVKEFCDALVGDLYRRAASTVRERHRFRVEDIRSSSAVLQHLSNVSPEDAHLWQMWSGLSSLLEPTTGEPISSSPLPYQEWREVQPTAAAALAGAPISLLALVGRAGLGKTTILAKLLEDAQSQGEQALWLTGFDLRGKTPTQVRATLSIGAFSCHAKGQSLKVYIDALENAADNIPNLQGLLASLSDVAASQQVRITITIRDVTWGALLGTQEALPQWERVDLAEWNEDRVSALVCSSQRPGLSHELIRLLCTPLLLDLFLRTFGTSNPVPPGLQTRHQVLRATAFKVFSSGGPAGERTGQQAEGCRRSTK
jgi:hypothetical protein